MKRKCRWCHQAYDTKNGSSRFCASNPRRVSNIAHYEKHHEPKIVEIGVMPLAPNPWVVV